MKRIQRKRTKGWKMPENAVYVGRPTKWGNPFRFSPGGYIQIQYKDGKFRKFSNGKFKNPKILVDLYRSWILVDIDMINHIAVPPPDISELKGKDLACWCPLDKPCHTDVLIELLNT